MLQGCKLELLSLILFLCCVLKVKLLALLQTSVRINLNLADLSSFKLK